MQILNVLEQLQKMDLNFKNDKIISNAKQCYKHMRLEMIFAIIFSILLIIYVIILDSFSFVPSYPSFETIINDSIMYYLTYFCTTNMLLQFCCFLGVIRQRFKWLNQYIGRITEKKFATNHISISKTLNKIQKYHRLLNEMCGTVQNIYSFQLLMMISQNLLTFLSTAFIWIHILIKKEYPYQVIRQEVYLSYSIGMMLFQSLQTIVLVICCSKTAREVSLSITKAIRVVFRIGIG